MLLAFINTSNMENSRWRPPLVCGRRLARNLSGHLHERRAGGVRNVCCKFAEMNEEISVRNPGGSIRAKMLWNMCEVHGRGDEYKDPANERENHPPKCGPAGAVDQAPAECFGAEALRREELEYAVFSTAGGSRT